VLLPGAAFRRRGRGRTRPRAADASDGAAIRDVDAFNVTALEDAEVVLVDSA